MTTTHTHTPTLTQTQTTIGPCHCGCSDCQGDCCSLECLTKPNFFCGQVLTDNDLKALVDWTSAKGALQRFRDGWGVACGLEVTCSHEIKQPSRVVAAPGYAVDCCGRDIVVCDPIYYDFTCAKPFDPCCPERTPEERPPYGEQPDNERKLGCIPLSELRAFELCLRFEEKLSGGQRALVRGNCRPLDECQYTRVIETGKLYAKEVIDPCAPPSRLVEEKYRRELGLFLKELAKYKSPPKTLLDWVHGKLHSFCFVEECLCELEQVNQQEGPAVAPRRRGQSRQVVELERAVSPELLFYIVQDWRNHYFQCLCESCESNSCEGDGVPLARVWVWNKTEGDCKVCKVVQIDSYPPYRRLLGTDCRPSDPDCIDLTRYIWREVDEVREELCKVGLFIVLKEPFNPASTLEVLGSPIHDLICAPCRTPLIVTTYRDICGRERVVTFKSGDNL
ncbi:MAG: hypothetical protein AABN95_03500 [Acidobacteriota bacterium]